MENEIDKVQHQVKGEEEDRRCIGIITLWSGLGCQKILCWDQLKIEHNGERLFMKRSTLGSRKT